MRDAKQQARQVERIRSSAERQRKTEQVMRDYEQSVTACAEATWRAMMSDGAMLPRFFYFKRSEGATAGQLITVSESEEAPDGFELVDAERVPPSTREHIRHWMRQRTHMLPILPVE